ncbi:ATP-binding response regulator [Thioclava sp. FR2]|uniref:ATP-binding response regulator n=1 Tax=Thioclava sp. FR2 TaxID=3445780 RepID=UPI003EB91ADC
MEERNYASVVSPDFDPGGFVPTGRVAIFTIASLLFVLGVASAADTSENSAIYILNYSHPSIAVLAVGLAVLPLRLAWYAFSVFFMTFLLGELVNVGLEISSGWTAFGMLKALPVALAVGFAGGATAKSLSASGTVWHLCRTPENSALIAGAVVALVGFPLAALALWADAHDSLDSEKFLNLAGILAQRIGALALVTTASILLLRAPPQRKDLPEFLLQVGAFLAVAIANKNGFEMFASADPALLGVAFVFLRPIRPTLAGTLCGICVYFILNGNNVELTSAVAVERLKNEQTANLLFFVLVLAAALRMKAERVEKVQLRTLGRMARAQELARYGHFTYEPPTYTVRSDEMVQRILNIPQTVNSLDFLKRVHPEDREVLQTGFLTMQEEETSFSFRCALDGTWSPETKCVHVAGIAIREVMDGVPAIIYGVLVDVTREHSKEEQMLKLVTELSERQGQQTQLFSIISHELRTPASILSLLLDEMDESKDWTRSGPRMRGVLDQLLSILSDMRQTVRPEQNMPIRIENFQPAVLATSIVETFGLLAQSKGISIRTEMSPDANVMRSADKVRLNQTLSNLVKNAIVHSQATEVVLSFETLDGEKCLWRVSDNGRNIPEEQRTRLFQPFMRSSTEGIRSDGSGLGLYIAKGAIELLGGSLNYEERPMSGASFTIMLPMPVAALGGNEQSANVVQNDVDVSNLSILVLEDSETMGEILSERLSRHFKSVKWLRDGAAGLAWLAVHDVDVVATDLYMPGMNGRDLAERLRKRGFGKPIIGMTAAEAGKDVERFRISGADAVLTKPVGPKDIVSVLSSIKEKRDDAVSAS